LPTFGVDEAEFGVASPFTARGREFSQLSLLLDGPSGFFASPGGAAILVLADVAARGESESNATH